MNAKPTKEVFVRTMYIMVILALAFSMTGSAFAQEPAPYIRISDGNDYLRADNFTPNTLVTFTVYASEGSSEVVLQIPLQTDEAGHAFIDGWEHTADLVTGNYVVATDGTYEKQLVLEKVTIEVFDPATDLVSGTAPAGRSVWVVVGNPTQGYPAAMSAPTDGNGVWIADFSGVYDFSDDMWGSAELYDEDGDATVNHKGVPPPPPNPHFTVFPEWEWFDGLEWPDGVPVSITVEGKSECTTEGTSSEGFFNGNFGAGCDVVIGDTVTFDDGATSRTHVVRNLAITVVDLAQETITGTADADTVIYISTHDGSFEPFQTVADEFGVWQVDLDDVGYDIQSGSAGRSEIRAEDGNATAVDWEGPPPPPNPHFTVFPEWEWLDGLDWPDDADVVITVEDKPECETTKESWGGFFNGNFGEGCDLEIGDTVTFDDGATSRMHVVRNLAVTAIDLAQETITGTADEGTVVYVWPHDGWFEPLQAVANEFGVWQVDLDDVGYDIQSGSTGRSEIRAEDGNATAVDWEGPPPPPNPWFSVFPEQDAVEGWDWPLDAVVHMTIDDPGTDVSPDHEQDETVILAPWGSGQLWVWFDFAGVYNTRPGDIVTLTDGETLRTHVVQNLSITGIDPDENTVFGAADAGQNITLWSWEDPEGGRIYTTADGSGSWGVDFDDIGFDLELGHHVTAEVWIDGNDTAVYGDVIPHDIYIFDTQTRGTRQLTSSADSHEFNPRWSPDGKKIVHDQWSFNWSSHGVYITDVKTGVSTPLAGAESGSYPTWSPSGKWIAFDRGADGDYRLFIVSPAGGEPTLVAEDAFMASWAPNSQRLAFHRPSDGAIWTTNLSGQDQTKVADSGNGPAWSPDGEWIAFEMDGDIWKVGVDNHGNPLGDPIQLTSSPLWEGRPTWSNNSKTIAFHAGMGQDTDIWTVSASGGTATWLTGTPIFGDYDPNYSFNGRYIAYSSSSPDGQAARSWGAAFSYDAGTWDIGEHSYYLENVYTWPEPGGETASPVQFTVSDDASWYEGNVLLRYLALRARSGDACPAIDPSIRPDQATLFHYGWMTVEMTYQDALAHFDSLTVTAYWDAGMSAELARHEIFPWSSVDWEAYICSAALP